MEQDRDYAAVKYSPLGEELWALHWPDPQGKNAWAIDIAVSPAGNVYLTGNVYDPAHQMDVVTLSLGQQDPADVLPAESVDEKGVLGLQALRNPVRETARLRYELGRSQTVGIGVYDATGRLVRSLGTKPHRPGSHEVAWDGRDRDGRTLGSGVYYVRVTTEYEGASTVAIRRVR